MRKRERQLRKAFKQMLRSQESIILDKLIDNERKYRFGWVWRDGDWQEKLWRDLPHHVTKGDPRDVAIYAAFCMYHGWRTAPPGQPYLNHLGEHRAVDPNLTVPHDLLNQSTSASVEDSNTGKAHGRSGVG